MRRPCRRCGARLTSGATACSRCGRFVEDPGGADAAAPALDDQWRLELRLGRGPVAEVWRAKDLTLERPLAVKLMHAVLARNPAQVASFERAAKILATLEHPNLLPALATGRLGARPFVVTRMLEGKTLAEAMYDSGGRLPDVAAARIFLELVTALASLHSTELTHGALKPSNVFLGGDGRVTLLGLGSGLDGLQDSRRREAMLSAPHYLSPEEISGGAPLGAATDVYALGCLLFDALVGHPPFPGEPPRVLASHLTAARPEARAFGASVGLSELARQAMAVAASERPTLAEVERVLRRFTGPGAAAARGAPSPASARRKAAAPRASSSSEVPTQAVVFTPTSGSAAYPDLRPSLDSVAVAPAQRPASSDGPTAPLPAASTSSEAPTEPRPAPRRGLRSPWPKS